MIFMLPGNKISLCVQSATEIKKRMSAAAYTASKEFNNAPIHVGFEFNSVVSLRADGIVVVSSLAVVDCRILKRLCN